MTTKEENPGGWESDHLAQEAKSQEPQQLTIQEEQTEFRPISTEETLPPFFHNVEAAAQDTLISDAEAPVQDTLISDTEAPIQDASAPDTGVSAQDTLIPDIPTSPIIGRLLWEEAWPSVHAVSEDQQRPKTVPPLQRWLTRMPEHVGVLRRRPLNRVLLILAALLLVSGAYAAARPWIPASSATVRITPASHTVADSDSGVSITPGNADPTKNPVGARRITRLTSSRSMNVPATGSGHQNAAAAHGDVLATVEQGQLPSTSSPLQLIEYHLVSNSGVKIVVYVGGFTLMTLQGQYDLQGFAENPGSGGNIPAYDINGTYYDVQNPSLVLFLQNPSPFTGGQDAYDYTFVQQYDIDEATSTLSDQLTDSVSAAKAAIQSQLAPHEQLFGEIQCNPRVTANHRVNDRARDVTVSVAMNCVGITYDVEKVSNMAMTMVSQFAPSQIGEGYALVGKVEAAISPNQGTDNTSGTVYGTLSARGVWVFQVTGALKQHFAALIASQPQTDATKLLLRQRGIASVSIQLSGGLGTALPYSADSIQIVVLPVKGL